MRPYDLFSPESIYKYAKMLEDKTFKDAIEIGQKYFAENSMMLGEDKQFYDVNVDAKGGLGHLIEKYFFGYEINSGQEADFFDANMELKVVPLKRLSNKNTVKERVVLTMINYDEIINEQFEGSHLLNKAQDILMIFYLHDTSSDKMNYKIKNVFRYTIPDEDYPIIKRDWETIVSRIREGKAHELSEAETLFVGACTKGVNSKSLRSQPFSDEKAMQRAFSFKSSYINFIYKNYVTKGNDNSESIIKSKAELEYTEFEQLILSKITMYYGKSKNELKVEFGLDKNHEPKQIRSMLIYRILGIKSNNAKEFVKANIVVKTIRLSINGIPYEAMSFPTFKFKEIVEQEWEDSQLYQMFGETKFLLVVFRKNSDGEDYLESAKFWNMPVSDLEGPVKEVWEMTKSIIREGIKTYSEGSILRNNLPSSKDNPVCHVRPHGRTKDDSYPLSDGGEFTKQCFWLNKSYIIEIIKNED